MTDYETIMMAAEVIRKGRPTNFICEEEATKKGPAVFIATNDPCKDDCQSIHMQFSFDEDGELICIG